jgi:hypothetical protein
MNLYEYVNSRPLLLSDPSGQVTFEQINDIAKQLGIEPIDKGGPENRFPNATVTIKAIQSKLGFQNPDGDFGPGSVEAYENWAKVNQVAPVKLRDPKQAKEVLNWVVEFWPDSHRCASECPVSFGEVLALFHFESADRSTRKPGSSMPVYFNAIGGPFASRRGNRLIGTTAVGLAQFTEATADRSIAYDGRASIKKAMELMFQDAGEMQCEFSPEGRQRALQRWEAWRANNADIKGMGKRINDLIKEKDGHENVTNEELNSILGIN